MKIKSHIKNKILMTLITTFISVIAIMTVACATIPPTTSHKMIEPKEITISQLDSIIKCDHLKSLNTWKIVRLNDNITQYNYFIKDSVYYNISIIKVTGVVYKDSAKIVLKKIYNK